MAVVSLAVGLLLSAGLHGSNAQEADCSQAETQTDMNICAGREFDEADAALNAAYRKAMGRMRARDAAEEPERRGAAKALLAAERGWIAYRDGQCEAEGFDARGGTLEPLLIAECKTRLTYIHTKELLDLAPEN